MKGRDSTTWSIEKGREKKTSFSNLFKTVFQNILKHLARKGIIFYERYTKGVPFLPEMVYKRARVWTSGRSLPE